MLCFISFQIPSSWALATIHWLICAWSFFVSSSAEITACMGDSLTRWKSYGKLVTSIQRFHASLHSTHLHITNNRLKFKQSNIHNVQQKSEQKHRLPEQPILTMASLRAFFLLSISGSLGMMEMQVVRSLAQVFTMSASFLLVGEKSTCRGLG